MGFLRAERSLRSDPVFGRRVPLVPRIVISVGQDPGENP